MKSNNAGLYVHIPFCQQRCFYCDFYTLPGQADAFRRSYIKALTAHIKESGRYTGKGSKGGAVLVDSIYVGGGTPTVAGTKALVDLLACIGKNYQISAKAEISLEANPETVTAKDLKKLRKAGYNRISMGVQAVQEPLLRRIGRIHTAERAADAVRDASNAGFENISIDLMYGLPGQSADMVSESLETALSWPVTHISLYGLKLSEDSPMGRENPVLPHEDEQAETYLNACARLQKAGFEQYEISNFARPGYACRHNMKYWTMQPYLGFGAAAHSDFGGKRYSFVKDAAAYIEGIGGDASIMEEQEQIPMAERAGEYIMLGLRTTQGVSSNEYTRLYRASFDGLERKLEQCAKWGLAEMMGDRWRLTPGGFLVSNRILGELLDTKEANP